MTNELSNIQLGGTARQPEDVQSLYDMGLEFAEIPIKKPEQFEQQTGAYAELKNKLGLFYLCHGPREGDPNDTAALENEYFPKIVRILPLMQKLGMSLLTIHLWMDSRFVRKEAIAYKIALLGRIIHRADLTGIRVCLENLSEKASDLERPFGELPLLNMTLDLGHAQLISDLNRSFEFMDSFPDRIGHIHLHDNRGGESYLDDLHLPPGEGTIDFESILKRLKDIEYKKTVALELKPSEIKRCLGYVKALLS